MPDIEILSQMIKDSARVELEDRNGVNQVKLAEPQNSTSVTISGVPHNAIVVKADAFNSPYSVFQGAKGECKRADFVIVADGGDKKVIICIEMKAGKDSEKEIIQQLTGARCFIAYCQEVGKSFWQEPSFLKEYAYRFVSINHISIPKRKTRIGRNSSVHDRPDRMLKISSPHRLEFNHLAGKR
jgi:hypothetical protein